MVSKTIQHDFYVFPFFRNETKNSLFFVFVLPLHTSRLDPLLGSGSEDEEDDEPAHHIRGGGLGLGALVGLGGNGPDSLGALGPSDMSVQSANSDSKMTQDDSDQVSHLHKSFVNKTNRKRHQSDRFDHSMSMCYKISSRFFTNKGFNRW